MGLPASSVTSGQHCSLVADDVLMVALSVHACCHAELRLPVQYGS